MLSNSLRVFGSRSLAAVAASRSYSTIEAVPLAEQEDYIRKVALNVMNAVPKGEEIRDHWPFDALTRKLVPGADDVFELETAWLDRDPKEYLENDRVTLNDFPREPEKISHQLRDGLAAAQEVDPLPEALRLSGITTIQYRKDVNPHEAVNWDHYAKEFPDIDVKAMKVKYEEVMKEADELTAAAKVEHEKTCERLKDVFAWAMADHRVQAKKILAEIEATNRKISQVEQAGFELETQTYEDFCEENPDFVEALDVDLIQGNWCVEDEEDLPQGVGIEGYDWSINYPMRTLEEQNEFWMEFNKKLDQALYGGSV